MNNHFLPANVAQLKKKGMKGNLNKWKEIVPCSCFIQQSEFISLLFKLSRAVRVPSIKDSMNVFKIAHHMLAFSTTAFPMLCLITSGTAMNRSRVYFMPLLTQNTWHQQTVRGNCFLKDLLSFFSFFSTTVRYVLTGWIWFFFNI